MITKEQLVAEARTWLETPFVHQGRVKGVGADCVGIIIGAARDLGLSDFDTQNYSRYPDVEMMDILLNKHLIRIEKNQMQDGDILWMRVRGTPQHIAMKTNVGILHANSIVGKCVETVLDKATDRMIFQVFRLKGVK